MKITPNSVFVYGTLMAPEVIETLIGRVPSMTPARVMNYIRHPVKQHVFPGLVAKKDHPTRGILVRDLSDSDMKRLDWFEDVEYRRIECQVETEEGNFGTQLYLWGNPISELTVEQEWDYDLFRSKNLQWYLENTVRPCRAELDRLKI